MQEFTGEAEAAQVVELTPEQKEELNKITDVSKIRDAANEVIARQKERDEKKKQFEESKIKVLILGSRHLASHLVFAMRNIARITVVDRNDPAGVFENPLVGYNMTREKIVLHQFSELDFERNFMNLLDVGSYDYIINTISIHDERYSNANPVQTMNTNVVFTQMLMDCLINQPGNAKMIYASTDKVYGDVGVPSGLGPSDGDRWWSDFMIKEDDISNPKGIKAISRKLQEDLIVHECKTYGLPYIALRIGNMFGRYTPKDAVMNQMIIDGFQGDNIYIYGDQYASRDFIDIEDVTGLIVDICTKEYGKDVWSEIYNVGGQYPSRMFIWGVAQFFRTFFSGANVVGLSPEFEKLGYLKRFMQVRVRNMPARYYEDKEEAAIRIWMNTDKVQNKLGFHTYQNTEWQDVAKQTILWNAAYNLGKPLEEVKEIRSKLARTR